MTADPRLVKDARPLSVVTYAEICNMAYQGAHAQWNNLAEEAKAYPGSPPGYVANRKLHHTYNGPGFEWSISWSTRTDDGTDCPATATQPVNVTTSVTNDKARMRRNSTGVSF